MRTVVIFGGRIARSMRGVFVDNMKIGKRKRRPLLMFILAMLVVALGSLQPGTIIAAPTKVQEKIALLQSVVSKLKADKDLLIQRITKSASAVNPAGGFLIVGGYVTSKRTVTFDFPISLTSVKASAAAMQADLVIPAGFTLVSITAGPASTAAGKQVTASGGKFIIFGLNTTPLGEGVIAIAKLSVAATTPVGLVPISLIAPVASDKAGLALPIAATCGIVKVIP